MNRPERVPDDESAPGEPGTTGGFTKPAKEPPAAGEPEPTGGFTKPADEPTSTD